MRLSLTARVLRRLAEAEACETNPHACDDLQIARLTVLHAARGDAVLCSPHVLASYEVLGLHPDKVWPAVQARRCALGVNEEFSRRDLPPKKPPATAGQVVRSSQLWLKKTNGARAANSHAGNTLLRDNTISVPMAAPSIAAGYSNSDAPSSGKRGEYFYDDAIRIVKRSGAPDHVRSLTLDALVRRGPWPKKQGPVSPIITVSVRSLQDESGVWRSTIQRRIRRAQKDQYWRREGRAMNSWLDCPKCGAERHEAKCPKCPHKGNGLNPNEFRRTFTYSIDLEKFERTPPCRQVREIRDLRAKGKPATQIHVVEEAKAEPEVRAEQPPAKPAEHRNAGRALTPRQTQELARRISLYEEGCTKLRDVNGWVVQDLEPGHGRYIKPLPREMAVLAACKSLAQGDEAREFEPLNCTMQRAIEAAKEMEASP